MTPRRGPRLTCAARLRAQAHQGKITSRAPKDKELMSDFIAKKREMFLVQMSLNTKREEIYKLEQRAAARDMALAESEQMLDHDRERFENFITEARPRVSAPRDSAQDRDSGPLEPRRAASRVLLWCVRRARAENAGASPRTWVRCAGDWLTRRAMVLACPRVSGLHRTTRVPWTRSSAPRWKPLRGMSAWRR